MSDNVVTLATFNTPGEAQMARNMLEEQGIKAMIADEELIGMNWCLSNAIGGVKLLVLESQWMQARVALAQHQETLDDDDDDVGESAEDYGDESPEDIDEQITAKPLAKTIAEEDVDRQIAQQPMRFGREPGLEEPEPIVISEGEDLAARAFRASLFGIFLLFPPIFHLYSAWLLLKLFRWDGELSDSATTKVLVAMVIDVAVIIFASMIVFGLLLLH